MWPLHMSHSVAMGRLRWLRTTPGSRRGNGVPTSRCLRCPGVHKALSSAPKTRAVSQTHDAFGERAEPRLLGGAGAFSSLVLENFAFSIGLIEVEGNARVALERVSPCHLSGVGMLGDLRNKEFPEFTRALHIFKLLCQSNDTLD